MRYVKFIILILLGLAFVYALCWGSFIVWEIHHFWMESRKEPVARNSSSSLPTVWEFDEKGFIILRDDNGKIVEKVLFLDCDVPPENNEDFDYKRLTSRRIIRWFAPNNYQIVYQIQDSNDWDNLLSHLPDLPCSLVLEISNMQINEQDVKILSQIHHEVDILSLMNCSTTPKGLRTLQKSDLHRLRITRCHFSPEDYEFLFHSKIYELYFEDCPVDTKTINEISHLSSLERLSFLWVSPKLKSEQIDQIVSLNHLKFLHIIHSLEDSADISKIKQMNLVELTIDEQ